MGASHPENGTPHTASSPTYFDATRIIDDAAALAASAAASTAQAAEAAAAAAAAATAVAEAAHNVQVATAAAASEAPSRNGQQPPGLGLAGKKLPNEGRESGASTPTCVGPHEYEYSR